MDAHGHQFIEGEYMLPEEYDDFLTDPSDYCMRVFLPRALGCCTSFSKLPQISSMLGRPQSLLFTLGQPDVQSAFQSLVDAGKEMSRYQQVMMKFGREAQAAGFPSMFGGVAMAPFDTLGDALRGTKGVIMDMFQRPDKVLPAGDRG